jgi:hypothetical protein
MADLPVVVLTLVGALFAIPRGLRLAFGEAADARRELNRHPLQRIASLQGGPAHVAGRVVACTAPVSSPLAGQRCIAYLTTLALSSPSKTSMRMVRRPLTEQRFLIDDGSGRALVTIPPPPPEPLPGDDYDYEILCSLGASRRERSGVFRDSVAVNRIMRDWSVDRSGFEPVTVTEGLLRAGDEVAIGGYASLTVDPTADDPAPYRAPPTRFMLTATQYYPLLIVKR